MKLKILLVMLLSSLFLACSNPEDSEDGDIGLYPGAFSGVVGENPASGLYEELAGTAEFSYGGADSVFEISLRSNVVSDAAPSRAHFRIKSLSLIPAGNYSFSDVETITAINSNNFSGFFRSPEIGGGQYYSESGTLTITESLSERLRGNFAVTIFSKVQIDEDEYERRYTTLEGAFHALFKE